MNVNIFTLGAQNPRKVYVYRDLEDAGYTYVYIRTKPQKKPQRRTSFQLIACFTVKYTVK